MASYRGHEYFTDAGGSVTGTVISDVVRKLNARTGWMTSVAGVGLAGSSGVGGPAGRAELSQPCAVAFDHAGRDRPGGFSGVAVDFAGNLVLVGPGGIRTRARVMVPAARSGAFYGRRMRAGQIYTVWKAGNPEINLGSVTVDRAGNPVVTGESSMFVVAARSGTFDRRHMRAGHAYTLTCDRRRWTQVNETRTES